MAWDDLLQDGKISMAQAAALRRLGLARWFVRRHIRTKAKASEAIDRMITLNAICREEKKRKGTKRKRAEMQ